MAFSSYPALVCAWCCGQHSIGDVFAVTIHPSAIYAFSIKISLYSAIKVVMQRRFSLLVFAGRRSLSTCSRFIAMTTGRGELYGFSHTPLGANLIGLLCGPERQTPCRVGLRLLRELRHMPVRWRVLLA
ncbi:MAG: hypothetical protein IPH37_16875 [Burkholderiales bacterium]|nr:hypothetical protein [Burkholderiales bacterium]